MTKIKIIAVAALLLLLVGTIGSILTFRLNDKPVSVLEEKTINKSFTALNINTDNEAVEIIPTKDATTKVKLSGKRSPNLKQIFEAKVEGETLDINLKEKQIKFFNFDFLSTSLVLKVYVPEKLYESIQIDNDNGHVQMRSLHVKNVRAKTNNGNIELKNITAANVDIQSDNGTIRFSGDITGKVTGETNNGKIFLDTPSIDHPIQLEADNGSITIQTDEEPSNVTYDVHVDNGTINIFNKYTNGAVVGNGANLIKLTTNNGKITVRK
ncbi:DUF4097 family beta strand repeat-containing protein [Neobacillus soli]|uniref:DUF4097 family beta strand repeat-containing protein n=1 Tax=Neobacillus soli TaxID=220688 RepID=UPI000824C442|nr:DUF4097 family beta strand repeat-containing protein [Neobacillus soli]